MPVGMTALSVASAVAFAAFQYSLFRQPFEAWGAGAGFAFHLAALSLFTASVAATRRSRLTLAFDDDVPEHIARHGPYRWVRHPFYLSYILFWVGCAAAAFHVVTVTAAALLTATYVLAAVREERKFARSALAHDYRAYARQAGLLWPKVAPRRHG